MTAYLALGHATNKIRVVCFAAKGIVAGAEGVADDDGDLGDDRVAYGVDHFRTSAYDAGLFGFPADHEACNVLKENEGQLHLIAIHDKARGLSAPSE